MERSSPAASTCCCSPTRHCWWSSPAENVAGRGCRSEPGIGECDFLIRESMSQTPGQDDDRVLENSVDLAGRLLSLPGHHKQRLAESQWLVDVLQPRRLSRASEVNRVITRR